jgi:hypothetical protein
VVGYNLPNERSEVYELIENIFDTFGVRIGVIDFRSLIRLAVIAVSTGHKLVLQDFRTMKGIMHVKPATAAGRGRPR